MAKLLVIDDEPSIHFSIEQVFADEGIRVFGAETAAEGLQLADDESPDVILLDIRLGDRSGLDVFHDLRRLDPRSLIIFITGHGTTDTAIEAMKLGAYDYLVKPLDADQLQQVVDQAFSISRLMHVPTILEDGDRPEDKPDRLIGSGSAMQTVCKQIGRVAPQDVNVLILGESGTGKELVARAIYHHSRRNREPFLAINCAAIPEPLLESELFGHERGAFTGADRRRVGKFEQSHGGTLLLDEIGDMAPARKPRSCACCKRGRLNASEAARPISADVRIIAATNQDLDALIERGEFRNDLYYRLRGVTIHLPPLREPSRRHRRIGPLLPLPLQQATRNGRTVDFAGGTGAVGEVPVARERPRVAKRDSRGADRFGRLHDSARLSPRRTPSCRIGRSGSGRRRQPDARHGTGKRLSRVSSKRPWPRARRDIYRRALDRFDRLVISHVMRHAGGQQNRAAEILGLSRVTLRAKLRHMQLSVEKVLAPREPEDRQE